MEKQQQIKQLFEKLKKGHEYYKAGDEVYRGKLLVAIEGVFTKLEALGVARHFSEALLIWGMEFVESVVQGSAVRPGWTIEDAEAIFGAKAREMTPRELRAAKIAEKHGVLVYEILPGDQVKIKVHAKKA